MINRPVPVIRGKLEDAPCQALLVPCSAYSMFSTLRFIENRKEHQTAKGCRRVFPTDVLRLIKFKCNI